jgi:hypothetical protein
VNQLTGIATKGVAVLRITTARAEEHKTPKRQE